MCGCPSHIRVVGILVPGWRVVLQAVLFSDFHDADVTHDVFSVLVLEKAVGQFHALTLSGAPQAPRPQVMCVAPMWLYAPHTWR